MKRILVIDDDKHVRQMLRLMLEHADYSVADASDGEVGLRLYREAPFDLIITDIFMPEKEGLETIRELKKDYPDVRIIAISGGGSTGKFSYLPLAKSFGALRTISKPFRKQEILAAVRDVLEGNGEEGLPQEE
ncbi:MAG: response regulator [Acidobacteriota bacterium]